MKSDFSILETLFPQIDTNLEVKLNLDGKTYLVEEFNVDYIQGEDHKGQPQSEVKGGQIYVVIKNLPDENIYDWAKRADKTKNGLVSFVSKTAGTIFILNKQRIYYYNTKK
jgi:hypothetical protein